MYMEFAGLPGSGKSTLSFALKKYLLSLPCNVVSRDEAILQCLKQRDDGKIKNILKQLPSRVWLPFTGTAFALPEFTRLSSRHLELVSFMSKMLSRSNLPELLIESIWNTIVRSFVEVQLVSQYIHDSRLVIMDEAFCQRCFTLFGYMEKKVPEKYIAEYAKLAPIADQVILIVSDPQLCVERFMHRYQSKRKRVPHDFKLDQKELLYNFKTGNRVLGNLCTAMEDMGKSVYRIKGDGNLNESITEVCKIFKPK